MADNYASQYTIILPQEQLGRISTQVLIDELIVQVAHSTLVSGFTESLEAAVLLKFSGVQPSLIFQELNNDPTELRGFFQIHQVARVTDHHAAGS